MVAACQTVLNRSRNARRLSSGLLLPILPGPSHCERGYALQGLFGRRCDVDVADPTAPSA